MQVQCRVQLQCDTACIIALPVRCVSRMYQQLYALRYCNVLAKSHMLHLSPVPQALIGFVILLVDHASLHILTGIFFVNKYSIQTLVVIKDVCSVDNCLMIMA